MGNERVSTDLPGDPGDHEDDSGVNRSTQRRQMPLCARERSGQRDWIDGCPESSKIFANLDQQREMISCRTNSQLSTIDSQPSTALYERRIKREAKLTVLKCSVANENQ